MTDIFNYLTEHNIAATIVVPQCPSGGGWTNQLRKVVNELLRTYVTSGAVDESRVYVTGGSMGGTGTWCQLSYFPYFYAAAMPVAGNPTNLSADNISKTPVYTVMGTDDTIMDVSPVEELRQQVTQNNGTMIMDVEEGWTHQYTCENSFTEERLSWLFSQVRDLSLTVSDVPDVNNDTEPAIYNLQGMRVTDDYKGIKIKKGMRLYK